MVEIFALHDGCGGQDDLRKLRIFGRMGTGLILHAGGCVKGSKLTYIKILFSLN